MVRRILWERIVRKGAPGMMALWMGSSPCAPALAAQVAAVHGGARASGSLQRYSHLDAAEVGAYSRRFGGDGVADAAEIAAGGKQDLVVVHHPPSQGGFSNRVITVVGPDRRLYNFPINAQSGGEIQKAATRSGVMAAVFAQSGAHTQRLYVLVFRGGRPSLVGRFSGDSGLAVWLQDGQLEVAENNNTGVLFKGANGQPDEKGTVSLARFNGRAFASVGGFSDGVFQYEPSMQTNPQYDAAAFISALIGNRGDVREAAAGLRATPAFLQELRRSAGTLGFLRSAPGTMIPAISTARQSADAKVYRFAWGGRTIRLTLQSSPLWTLAGFLVLPSPNGDQSAPVGAGSLAPPVSLFSQPGGRSIQISFKRPPVGWELVKFRWKSGSQVIQDSLAEALAAGQSGVPAGKPAFLVSPDGGAVSFLYTKAMSGEKGAITLIWRTSSGKFETSVGAAVTLL